MRTAAPTLFALAICGSFAAAQPSPQTDGPPKGDGAMTAPGALAAAASAQALSKGVEVLLKLQEGEGNAEWPYEGVYRVKGKIPQGYRVGGTAICALALVEAPGFADDQPRQEAVARAVKFVCDMKDDPLLSVQDYDGGYDVRSWGHIQAVECLCRVKQLGALPAGQEGAVDAVIRSYIDAIQQLEVPRAGGWNYARPQGRTTPGAPSSFMTSSALQALFEARRAGYDVDEGVVTRALDFLEKTRGHAGAVAYSGFGKEGDRLSDAVPGAVGRMCAVEATLYLAGRGSVAPVRSAVDAFIVHWDWLNQRRAKPGTHERPYAIAPYYFMYAHHYAAQAVELLPKSERQEYRRRVNELLFSVRAEDGSWNDRVFARSTAYGTAMAMRAMMKERTLQPASWEPLPRNNGNANGDAGP
jgi:hypothetical protein